MCSLTSGKPQLYFGLYYFLVLELFFYSITDLLALIMKYFASLTGKYCIPYTQREKDETVLTISLLLPKYKYTPGITNERLSQTSQTLRKSIVDIVSLYLYFYYKYYSNTLKLTAHQANTRQDYHSGDSMKWL